MSYMIALDRGALTSLLSTRKIPISSLEWLPQYKGSSKQVCLTFTHLQLVAEHLCMPIDYVLSRTEFVTDEFSRVVQVSRSVGQFERVKMQGAIPLYHYRHVLKTSSDPHLMVLRTSPGIIDPEHVRLNGGHRVKEFVYVLKGKVEVAWANKEGQQRRDQLEVGDSIYIDSWVPHAFYALIPESQILAVDYL